MARRNPSAHEESQSYLVTVSDLMAGLIFVFVLTLMIFAFRFQTATTSLVSAGATRTQILYELKEELELRDLKVMIDTSEGVLRLRESEVGFNLAEADPKPEHRHRVDTLAVVLAEVLPCYVANSALPCTRQRVDSIRHNGTVDVVLIEGHTDVRPIRGRFEDNLDLSGARAASVWRQLLATRPVLQDLRNRGGEPVLSIAGYGEQRLADQENPLGDENRRIDLRFVMEQPRASGAQLPVVRDAATRLEGERD